MVMRRKPDKDYLAFIASLPCLLCPRRAQTSRTEVAHVGSRGLGQRCSDRETVPLCVEHHRTGKEAHHVLGKRFWEHHRTDRDTVLAGLNAMYKKQVEERKACQIS
jgi:hypothetical protein